MNPKFRQSVYYVGAIIPSLLGLLILWGGVSAENADSVTNIVAGVVSLLGAAAPATAAITVSKQRKDGTFDKVSPADAVAVGVQQVIEAHEAAQVEFDKVKQVISDTVGSVPGFGPLTKQIIDLV